MTKSIHPYEVLRRPVITEKSTMLSAQGKYVFEVHKNANKIPTGNSRRGGRGGHWSGSRKRGDSGHMAPRWGLSRLRAPKNVVFVF